MTQLKKQLLSVALLVGAAVVLAPLAVADPTPSGQWPLGGSFVEFDRIMPQAFWAQEVLRMASLGQKYIVLPGCSQLMPSTSDSTGYTVNPTSMIYPSAVYGATGQFDFLGMILSLADQYGIQVFVGSVQTFNTDWTTGLEFNALDKHNPIVSAEIMRMYGSHPSLKSGSWYDAQEIELNWVKANGSTYYGITRLANYVAQMHTINPSSQVLAAPYFKEQASGSMPGLTAQEAGYWLGVLASGSSVTILAPQDGAGAQAGAPAISELGSYYSSMKAQLPTRTTLWSTLETFQAVTPGTESANGWMPAPLSRIQQQFAQESPYVGEMMQFMFGWDMSPEATFTPIEAESLYHSYTYAYASELPGGWVSTEYFGLPVTYSIAPSASYPDSVPSKLTNGTGGGYNLPLVNDWVGVATNNYRDTEVITVPINPCCGLVSDAELMFLGEASSGIMFPLSVNVDFQYPGDPTWHNVLTGGTVTPGVPTPQGYTLGWVTADWPEPWPLVSSVRFTITFTQWLFLGEVKIKQPSAP